MSGLTFDYIMRGESKKDAVYCYSKYSEPGYQTRKGILVGNWNDFQERTQDLLERAGYEIEWYDEWEACEECNGLVRTSGDSYFWQPSFVIMDNGLVCKDCLLSSRCLTEEYLESLENKPKNAVNLSGLCPEQYGYTRVGETQHVYQAGLHAGMEDNPERIFAELSQANSRLLFAITESSQFYIEFVVYSKKEDECS